MARWRRLTAVWSLLVLAGCTAPPDVELAGGAGGADDCVVSLSDGQTLCGDPRQRYPKWETYAIDDDGRTVTVTFTERPAPCVEVVELHGDVLPTEVHLTLSVFDAEDGCGERVAREASVTLDEPVAGRPVYTSVTESEGGGSSRGYQGSASGPQCHGPGRPAPGARVECPAPTSGPPPPLVTRPDSAARRAQPVPWTAVTVERGDRRLALQWVSADCARLGGVDVDVDEQQRPPALLLTVNETKCDGEVVVRQTAVELDRELGRRQILDGTVARP